MLLRPATRADVPAAHALLTAHHLPLDGLPDDLHGFMLAEGSDGRLEGLAGLERYAGAALLRSVVVATPGQGIGAALAAHLLAQADAEGVEVLLLTTTAERYFSKFGFAPIPRDEVPASLQASAEFQGACPASAVVMRRAVRPRENVASGTDA